MKSRFKQGAKRARACVLRVNDVDDPWPAGGEEGAARRDGRDGDAETRVAAAGGDGARWGHPSTHTCEFIKIHSNEEALVD